MTQFEVLLTGDAERDLEELYGYVDTHDSVAGADRLLDRIEKALHNLSTLPERGTHPKELLALGIRDCRQTFFKPYRLIYRVAHQRVCVYLIADGRRDLQSLLARRLFRA